MICLFFDGSPYFMAVTCSVLFMLNSCLLYYFIQKRSLRSILVWFMNLKLGYKKLQILCCISTSISFILCVSLFFWTAYLVYGEDKLIRSEGFDYSRADLLTSNRIVVNTRVAMYSLHMILTPIQGKRKRNWGYIEDFSSMLRCYIVHSLQNTKVTKWRPNHTRIFLYETDGASGKQPSLWDGKLRNGF